jgi:DNA-binding FadR family transcriptional regulator
MLDRSPVPTLTEQVMDWVRGRIAGRALGPGARLPSIRKLAETQGVSKSTVVEAYDRLAAEGVITARPGSGFYVTAHARPSLSPRLGHNSTAPSTRSGSCANRLRRMARR